MSDIDDQLTGVPLPEEFDLRVEPSVFEAPEQIGNYRILEVLGQGGMGVVYEAQQEQPVKRKVALKIIKMGMDTREVVARFESERQALALMDHPNIARVFDAGATEQGRPYFVMERVTGVPVTEYCDEHRLSTRQRLELFIDICEGVQHAHQKGIIHRDIKPSNVLVHDLDGKHVPKIIDFGIAKATDHQAGGGMTQMGQIVGTLEYMSPEQAEMGGVDIDTRADVYLLGILLYELLTGALPFDTSQLRQVGLVEFRRRILEDVPQRPSTRLTSTGTALTLAAQKHLTDPKTLKRLLRGDLDWITMKALEKDRTRRYASASELAADIGRYLRNEPVLASPPSNLYRLRKFVRRHRVSVAFSALVVMLLIGLAATMTIQRIQIARARDQTRLERDRAAKEAATSAEVSKFLESLFIVSDPSENLGNTITAREILDRGAGRIETELEGQPSVQGRLMRTMGSVYGSLGLVAQSRNLLETSLKIRRGNPQEEPLELAESLLALGTLVGSRFGEFGKARALFEEALEIRRAELGEDHLEVVAIKNDLAIVVRALGDYDAAEALWGEVFQVLEEVTGPEHPVALAALTNRAALLKLKGDYGAARPLYERVLEIRRKVLGPIDPKVALSLTNLAGLLEEQGDYEGARKNHEEAFRMREHIFGTDHLVVAESLVSLARMSLLLGDPAKAEVLHARAVKIHEESKGFSNPVVLVNESRYAVLTGKRDEALRYLKMAVDRDYSDVNTLGGLKDFETLKDDPRFEAILAEMRRRIAVN